MAHRDRVTRAGATVLQTVGSLNEARRAANQSGDIVVAQGRDAGGHVWEELGISALLPKVHDGLHIQVDLCKFNY